MTICNGDRSMLENFRDNMKGIAFAIVVLIAIVFAFSGIGSLSISGSASETAVKVNGERVSELQVQRAVNSEKQRILNENEGLDAAMLEDNLLRPQVLNQVIRRKLLSQEAKSGGMAISSQTTGKLLVDTPTFQTDGRFDQELYLYRVRNLGYTSASFLEMIEENLLIEQFVRGFVASAFTTNNELELLASIFDQQRDYYYLTLPLQPVKDAIKVTDQQVAAYYEDNKSIYQAEEQVVVDYIELNPTQFDGADAIGEEQIRARFEEQAQSLESGVSLQAAHILLSEPDAALLSEIQSKLDAGEDFAALAKQYSQDLGSADFGGDLGFTSGDTFPESFESALAALEVGQVSAPVETDSGTHLIKLVDKQETVIDFSTERARIKQELVAELRSEWLVETLAKLKELSYNAESLGEVAADLGLKAQVSAAFSRSNSSGIAAYPAVKKAAFSAEVIEENYASEVIDLGDDRYVVLKLNESIPARQKVLAEVKDLIVVTLINELSKAQLAEQGDALLARVAAGETVEAVAKSQDLNWQVVLNAKRSTGDINADVNRFVFQLPATSDSSVVESLYTRAGDYVVVAMTEVTAGDSRTLSAEQKNNLLYSGAATNNSRELQSLQASLMADAKIVE
jgi:peptidyl-prolyl cis-trans isomerase D